MKPVHLNKVYIEFFHNGVYKINIENRIKVVMIKKRENLVKHKKKHITLESFLVHEDLKPVKIFLSNLDFLHALEFYNIYLVYIHKELKI